MIATVTLNPSLDYLIKMKEFNKGAVNRSESEQVFPGGKGINVALMLQRFGLDVCCLGFVAGFTGNEIVRRLQKEGCRTSFVSLPCGLSRINFKLKAEEESEINGNGPDIGENELQRLFFQLEALRDGDTLVLAGSVPKSLPDNIYELCIKKLVGKKIKVAVDTTGDSLKKILPYHPFLVKPNHHELGELFGKELYSAEEIIEAAKKVQRLGARNVLVSRAGEGAVLLASDIGVLISGGYDAGMFGGSTSGFFGSLIAGFAGGYLVLLLRKLFSFLPASLESLKPILIYPVLGVIIIGAFMVFVVNPPMAAFNDWLNQLLLGMGESSRVILGLVLGAMMSIDFGGPLNKAAYVFGTMSLVTGNNMIMASVMVGGMVPPLAIALATTFFPNRFTKSERQAGITCYVMGLSFVTEGAIPFAASDPLRVIPSCAVGSAVAGALSMLFSCTLPAPHGGIFVLPVIGNWPMFLLSLAIGSVVGMLLLGLLKKPVKQEN